MLKQKRVGHDLPRRFGLWRPIDSNLVAVGRGASLFKDTREDNDEIDGLEIVGLDVGVGEEVPDVTLHPVDFLNHLVDNYPVTRRRLLAPELG